MDVIEKLDRKDKEKISYFANILLRKAKYDKLKGELRNARKQVADGDVLSHGEVWSSLNV
jgi:hypothetical protein